MDITCAIAMTKAEFAAAPTLPARPAWMSCHFSSVNDGLSNLPEWLIPGSLLMIDDSFPPNGHDPEQIANQLTPLLSQGISGVLLDFQRPAREESQKIADYLTRRLPCVVCITPEYAKDLDCAVLLPPPALHEPLEHCLSPWKNREIWLEALLERGQVTVTRDGSTFAAEAFCSLDEDYFTDTPLCCRYKICTKEDHVTFTLVRDREMLRALLEKAANFGVRQAVGLYQQLGPFL